MEHDNFRNLDRVIFTNRKHLSPEIMPLDTVFQELNDLSLTIWRNWLPFQETRAFLKYWNCLFDIWYDQSLVILFKFCCDFDLRWIRCCLSCTAGQSSFRRSVTYSWLDCRLLFLLILLNMWNIINWLQHSCMRSLLFFSNLFIRDH